MNSKKEVTEFDLRCPEFKYPEITPDMFEFDGSGEIVRKDRFEQGIKRIRGIFIEQGLASSSSSWCVDEVINLVRGLTIRFDRLKYLMWIIQNMPEDAEYFHFDNQEYVKNINDTRRKSEADTKHYLVFLNGVWESSRAYVEYIDVLVSIDDLKEEIGQIVTGDNNED